MAVMLPCSGNCRGCRVAAERQLVAVVDGGDAAVLGNCRGCRVAAERQLVAVVDGGDAAVLGNRPRRGCGLRARNPRHRVIPGDERHSGDAECCACSEGQCDCENSTAGRMSLE